MYPPLAGHFAYSKISPSIKLAEQRQKVYTHIHIEPQYAVPPADFGVGRKKKTNRRCPLEQKIWFEFETVL